MNRGDGPPRSKVKPRWVAASERGQRASFNRPADVTIQRCNNSRTAMTYCELHCCSAFSFLRGGSFPEQLAEVAAELEMPAMALLDRNDVYGAQRFSVAAREQKVRPIIGAELSMEDGGVIPVLVENRTGYKNLCELLTEAHLRSEKGKCAVKWDELPQFAEGLVALFNVSLLTGKIYPSSSPSPHNGEKGRAVDKMSVRLGPASAVIGVFGREN